MEKFLAVLIGVPAVILGVVFLSFLMAFPFMLAWDYVMPAVFKLPELSWTQAWALSFVGSALFKSSSTK